MATWVIQSTVVSGILAVVVALACRLGRLKPAARHALWLVVIVKLLLPPVMAWPWALPVHIAPVGLSASVPAPAHVETPAPAYSEVRAPMRVEAYISASAPLPRQSDTVLASPELATTTRQGTLSQPASTPVAISPRSSSPTRFAGLGAAFTPRALLVEIWLIGMAAVCLVQLRRILRIHRLALGGKPAPGWLEELLADTASRLEVRKPQVRTISGAHSPFLWGLGRPLLLLPESLVASLPQTRWPGVLAHELAHLKRRDHWVAWLKLAATCLWWWNPIAWCARRRLRENAELACDAWAVWAAPDGRREYAEALIDVFEAGVEKAVPTATLALGADIRLGFQERLTMLFHDNLPRKLSWQGTALAATLLLAALPAWQAATATDEDDGGQQATAVETLTATTETAAPEESSESDDDETSAPAAGHSEPGTPSVQPVTETHAPTTDTAKARHLAERNADPALEEALQAPVDIQFENEHIGSICETLCKPLDIEIVIDYRVVEPCRSAGQHTERRRAADHEAAPYVTDGIVRRVRLKNITLAGALEALLRPLNLTFSTDPGYIWVTSLNNVRSQSPPATDMADPTSATWKALSSRVHGEFEHEHLQDVCARLSEEAGLSIIVDQRIVEPPEASSPTALPWERAGWRSCGPTGMVHLGDGFVGAIFAGGEGLALHEILNMLGNSSSLAWRVEPEFIWISSPEMMLCDSYGVATDEPEIRCGLPTVYGGTCLGRGAGAPHAALSVTIPATGECISISPVYPRDDIIAGPYYMHVLDVYSEGSDLVVLLKRLKTGRVIRVTSPLPGSEGEAADKESFKEGIGPREGIETTAGKAEAVEAQEIRAKETAGLRLIRIRVMPDGTSRAQVGFASGAYNWYREKDRFERYQLLHIEPEKACIQIKDETTGETFTLTCEEQRGQDRGTPPPALR